MNILTDPLPTTVNLQNREVEIKTDFRPWLQFIQTIQEYNLEALTMDDYIEMVERISGILFETKPEVTYDLFPAVVAFFSGYSNGKKGESTNEKLVDYSIDADAIYASFAQVYGIRLLNETRMHWYEFRALFANLPEDCPVGHLMHIRGMKDSDVPKEKRAELRKLKQSVALPTFRSYAEDNEALNNLRKALK